MPKSVLPFMPGKLVVEKLLEGGKGELLAEEKGLLLAGGGKGEEPPKVEKGSAVPVLEVNGEDAEVFMPGNGERVDEGKGG